MAADTDADGYNGAAERSPSPRPGGESPPPRREAEPEAEAPREKPAGRDTGDVNPGNNLHVSNISNRMTEKDLEEAFGKYGKIEKAQVMFDPHLRTPRGFAFVTMDTAEEAEAAMNALNGTEICGRAIKVQLAKRGRARTPTPGEYHGPPKKGEGAGLGRPPGRGGRGGGYGGGGYGGAYGGGAPYGGGYGGGYRHEPPPPMRGGDPYGRPPMDFPIVAPRGARDYPPPRDPYDRYGGGGGGGGGGGYGGGYGGMRQRSPPPRGGGADAYDRYGAPPRDFPTRPPREGGGGGGRRRDDSPPGRGGPPPAPSRFSDGLPPLKSRYDDGLPPRRY